jgi:hypothetical protein
MKLSFFWIVNRINHTRERKNSTEGGNGESKKEMKMELF